MTRVYLAGPEVFLPNAMQIGEQKKAICAEHGMEGVFPLEAEIDLNAPLPDPQTIFDHCRRTIESCDMVIANLTPWRGSAADPGTVFEQGYAWALHKKVYAYTNNCNEYCQRVTHDGNFIEDFGLFDNLMLAKGLTSPATVAVETLPITDLTVFRRCVEQIDADTKADTERRLSYNSDKTIVLKKNHIIFKYSDLLDKIVLQDQIMEYFDINNTKVSVMNDHHVMWLNFDNPDDCHDFRMKWLA